MARPKINRRLTDDEKALLCRLAIASVVTQTGVTEQAAADSLDKFAAKGQVFFEGDAQDAYLVVNGHRLIHAERDWLAFHAHAPDWEQQT